MGDIVGLTTLKKPDGTGLIYGSTVAQNISLFYKDLIKNTGAFLTENTLPEKCVWSKKNTDTLYCAVPRVIPISNYPETWYQGLVSFSDNLLKINTKTGAIDMLIDPTVEAGQAIDGIKLSLDDKENYLIFINKKDSSLWSLELK